MSKAHPPELKKWVLLSLVEKSWVFGCRFMDKKLCLKLNGGRQVVGILRGFDPFMNLVVDESIEECRDGKKNNIGMVVSVW